MKELPVEVLKTFIEEGFGKDIDLCTELNIGAGMCTLTYFTDETLSVSVKESFRVRKNTDDG